MTAQRLLTRWSVRLLHREWRQQLSILLLVVGATAVGVAAVVTTFNLAEPPGFRFGAGRFAATVQGDGREAIESLGENDHRFGVVRTASVRAGGSANVIALREQDPASPVTVPLLALVDGAWPTGPGEIAVTDGVATASRAVGQSIVLGERRTIVGIVENPTDLEDEFVLVTDIDDYGVDPRLKTTELLVDAPPADVTLPAGTGGITVEDPGGGPSVRTFATIAVSLVTATALLIVALVIGAAFGTLARRRSRQYGLLAASGATPHQVRRSAAVLGAVTGLAAAAPGAWIGLVAAAIVVPRFESSVGHRVAFAVPWWTVAPTVALAVAVTTVAGWWPARALSRQPVVEVLASLRPRPPRTGSTTRAGAAGAVLGATLLVFGVRSLSAAVVVVGVVAATTGILLLAPGLIGAMGRRARLLPLTGRLAVRSIARRQSRSGAFVAALALALAAPVGVAVTTSSIDANAASRAPNLTDAMAIVWAADLGRERVMVPVDLDRGAVEQAGAAASRAAPGAEVVPIELAIDPSDRVRPMELPGGVTVLGIHTNFSVRPVDEVVCGSTCDINTLGDRDAAGNEILFSFHDAWIANPPLLAALGVDAPPVGVQAVSRLDGAMLRTHRNQDDASQADVRPASTIPANTSIAPTLILPAAAAEHGWERLTVGWLVVGPEPLSGDALDELRTEVGDAGRVESAVAPPSRRGVRAAAMAIGSVVGLAIVVAALNLLGAETAPDLRVLRSIGADPRQHRRLSAMTATALTTTGVLLAVPIGYLSLLVLVSDRATTYRLAIPWLDLAVLAIVVPAAAAAMGWIAGRTGPDLGRRPA